MIDKTPRLVKIGDAISQLINVAFLPRHENTTANESISGRAHRSKWYKVEAAIDWVFSIRETEHCKKAYMADVERAKAMVKTVENT